MEKAIAWKRGTGRKNALLDSHKKFKQAWEKAGKPPYFSYSDDGEIHSFRTKEAWELRKRFERLRRRK